jgi:hypothetical protein
MVSEDNLVVIYFTPSNRHLPTRLLECASRAEAETRIRSIVDYLKEINARQEGFHLLEHILLRPMNMDACQFNILGFENAVILKSKEARPRKDQQRDAFDTALLCCYSTNYKILKNAKKELVVMVKNLVGKELAVSSQTFLTELEAQKFIDTNVAFFNNQKNAGTLNSLLELDDEDKFFFCLLDPKGVLLFKGLETSDLSSQESTAREALTCGLYPARYSTRQEAENNFSIILTDSNGKDLARSPHIFPTALQAGQFIQKCIRMLEEARDPARLVEYRRVHGRNAAVFNSQLSVIYPKWTSRFGDQDFLQLFSQSLHQFVPAHIGVNLIGLDFMEMKAFEDLYFKYITELSNLSIENRSVVSKLSSDLLDLISNRTTQANPS